MNRNLLIIGAGQYGQVAKEIAEAMNYFETISFLDDENNCAIGKLCDYEKYSLTYSYAVVAIGDPKIRLEWISRLEEACYKIAILVHPKAYVASSAQIMRGSIIEPMAVVHTDCVIKIGCIISAGAVVNHNAMCFDACHIDCNATVLSNTLVPAGTHVLTGSVFEKKDVLVNDLFFNAKKWTKKTYESKKNISHGPLPINGREYCFEDGM